MSQVTSRVALAAWGQMLVMSPTLAAQTAAGEGGVDIVFVIGVLGIIVTLLALAVAGLTRWRRARKHGYFDQAPPLIAIPHSPGVRPVTPVVPWREGSALSHSHGAPASTAPATAVGAAPRPSPARQPQPATGNGSSADGDVVEGNTIRFYRPPEGTLQLLPGRLEIVAGEDIPHDIRFIRARGEDAEVTFGRSDGPPHRHVQLHARTVSRQHARMRFADRRWQIENLSETNPVVINGKELDSADGGYVLKEGDRIEMGEVVFLFRER